jgi:hypothetical protein
LTPLRPGRTTGAAALEDLLRRQSVQREAAMTRWILLIFIVLGLTSGPIANRAAPNAAGAEALSGRSRRCVTPDGIFLYFAQRKTGETRIWRQRAAVTVFLGADELSARGGCVVKCGVLRISH